MLNLSFYYYPIYVKSIDACDIENISAMLNQDNSIFMERNSISIKKLRLRFLEHFVSDDDFFLKVQYGLKIIGIIKGRIDFENSSAWISLFYLENAYRKRGIGKSVYSEIESILFNEFKLDFISVSVMINCLDEILFWENLGFSINRVVNNFYEYYDEKIPMVLLNKKLNIVAHKYN